MLQLSEIWIYPIKSLGGLQLQKAKITDRGLEHDRRWMLVNEKGIFLTQREYPNLSLFQTEIVGSFLKITHKENLETLTIPLNQFFSDNHEILNVTVWDDTIEAFDVGQVASDWFSKQLGFWVKLVYMPNESHRQINPNDAVSNTEINSFSDGYPFLIIGQASLDDLNARLRKPISMHRFRPNFVFTNGIAYEEENWKEFRIGEVFFNGIKPCARCVVTTIDHEKGIFSGKEPLKTLSQYKSFNSKVLFGQNVIGQSFGIVSIGDEVIVKSKQM